MTGRDAEREQLTALLIALWEEDAGESLEGLDGVSEAIDAYLERLLPVADRIANERAAAELAEMAQAARKPCGWGVRAVDAADLRARAAALRASNGTGATT